MRSILFIFAVIALFNQSSGLKIAQRNVTDMLTLTYVFGSDDAMLSHEDAMEFCRNLNNNMANAQIITSTENTGQNTPSPDTTSMPNLSKMVERSDLLSIHDMALVEEMMNWMQNIDSHQFWIGGLLKIVQDDFRHGRDHIIQLWTDHTLSNFRNLQYPSTNLDKMRPGDIMCLSVDYASGKWGVHSCETPMYFICETVRVPASELGMDATSSTTQVPDASTTVVTK